MRRTVGGVGDMRVPAADSEAAEVLAALTTDSLGEETARATGWRNIGLGSRCRSMSPGFVGKS